MRRAMAGRQGGRNDERRDLSGVLKECRARLASRTTAPGRFRSGSCCAGPGPGSCASAGAIGLTVPVATACSASPGPCALNLRRAAPTGAGQFASVQEAQYRCPRATVVWVNEHSHICHFAGTHDYGNTKQGAYMCEADVQAAGNRAAKNDRHP